MANWVEPVFDRTLIDVTNKTAKGYFNVSDYTRITDNTTFLKDLVISLFGWTAPIVAVPTVNASTIMTNVTVNTFVQNLPIVWTASKLTYPFPALKTDWQAGYGRDTPNYQTVNDWEKRIFDMKNRIVWSAKAQTVCGVGATGQAANWQRRWRINPLVQGL